MADMTLPPTEVTEWTDWYKLWALANRYGLLAGKNWQQATDVETYKALVQIINDALNGTTGGNLLPAVGQGSTILPAVAEGAQQALIAVNPTDPSAVGTISAQPIEGIVTGGGSIGTVIATVSGGSYGAVKRSVAALAAVSIFGTSILAFQMAQEKIDDLVTSLDPFADENDNIITYTDENGNTYLPHDVLEAVRQKLIEMGAYDTGGFTPPSPPSGTVTVTEYDYSTGRTTENTYNFSSLEFNKVYKHGLYWVSDGVQHKLDIFRVNHYDGTYTDYPIDEVIMSAHPISETVATIYYAIPLPDVAYGSISTVSVMSSDGFVYSTGQIAKPKRITINGKTGVFGFDNFQGGSIIQQANGVTSDKLVSNPISGNSLAYAALFGESGEGVEGMELQEDATIPSDPNQTLADYFPTWTGQGKAFNTIKKGVDGTIESIGETTFLPVTLKDTQPIIEGTTMNQTEAQEGTGQDNPDITNDLLPAIQELLEKIINSPDIPTPTIPAGDSGDTPPAEPPLISGSANGLWAIYNPTLRQVQDFGAYLWSENKLDQIIRMFNSPIDAVIGFHMIYCTPIKGPATNIKCGFLDTGVSSITVANQYATIDCGTVTVPEYYGTVLDYTATKLALYLPFIGIVPLSTAVCMSSTLHVIYRIDVLTGTCLAQVKVIKDNSEAVMYAFEGNCAVQIPLTATTYTGTVSALINTVSAGLSVFMGDYISAAGEVGSALGAAMTNLSGTKQSGSMGANAGALGIRIPYLIITHPAAYDAMRYNTQYGYPLNQTVALGDMTGYTKVKDIHLAGIPCTDDELEMIERLLKDGVIIN